MEKNTYYLNRVLDDISSNKDLILLPKSDCAGNGLVLNAGIPLQLGDEDSIGGG